MGGARPRGARAPDALSPAAGLLHRAPCGACPPRLALECAGLPRERPQTAAFKQQRSSHAQSGGSRPRQGVRRAAPHPEEAAGRILAGLVQALVPWHPWQGAASGQSLPPSPRGLLPNAGGMCPSLPRPPVFGFGAHPKAQTISSRGPWRDHICNELGSFGNEVAFTGTWG